MASLKDTSALKALNENEYINKLYDAAGSSQKKMLTDHYSQNVGALDTAKQIVQQQTDTNVGRTNVEAQKAAGEYKNGMGQNMSAGANAQAALSQDVNRQRNVTDLQQKQSAADIEIERRRKLLADQYSAAIKQAQADNDMVRAQQLYDAAKKEDAQLMALKQQAAQLMAAKGDNTIMDSLLQPGAAAVGGTQEQDGATWSEVTRNEESINKIYDAQLEAQRQAQISDYLKAVSDLEARQQQTQRQTDKKLNDAYVDSLRKAKNYAEVQNAYGQGSGTAAQAQLAQDAEMLRALTDIRGVQADTVAQEQMQGIEAGAAYREALEKANSETEAKRAAALLDAAEKEEATLLENQQLAGNQYAKENNYSVLGALYGLTQDQIDRLQGTGRYAPKSSSAVSKGLGKAATQDAIDYVDRMLDNISSSGSSPERIISGTNQLTAAQKNVANAYYKALTKK